ncbi:tudor domain-containing protein 5-like [Hyla sarda]|uniref:tudor domain-containing protein 5-like n=1 Tax=Hyla sarda TaxID=327740 RepID=UPI0024C222A1|nr:tudor domain-containing protein 5-like [Hyla sarda]XP_056385355.1 tudor domain-containing protein 5-like [Hyla sarda]XP_056385356.1 tudor domain-containing protein 5-like [Hyla sarda]
MNKERVLQTLKKEVRSLLIASKLGLSVQELEHDYRTLVGSPLPTKTLNYRSTMELLLDMPDVVKVRTQVDGSVLLSAVVNEQTKGIAELVSRQKTTCKRKVIQKRRLGRPLTHMDLVRRGRVAPVLPAFVKSDLRDLLSISPLLVSQLESSYYKRFGRSFQYTRYGFYSLVEVLRSVSDFVQVEQTKAGSLLILKTPVIHSVTPWSSLQCPPPGNVLWSGSLSVNKESNAPKKPPVPDCPLPSAAPKSTPLSATPKSPPLSAAPNTPPLSAAPNSPPPSAATKSPPPSAAPNSPPLFAAPNSPPPSAAPNSPPPFAAPNSPPPSAAPNTPPLSAATKSPPPSAAPKSGGVTTLDKLFMAAQAEYYANKPSVKSVGTERAQSERENIDKESILPSRPVPSATVLSINGELVSDPQPHIQADNTYSPGVDTTPIQTDVAEPSTDRSVHWLEKKVGVIRVTGVQYIVYRNTMYCLYRC